MKPIFLSVSPCCAASFLSKRLNINAATVNLAIWDTAGQERFHALGPIYYRDADGSCPSLTAFLFSWHFFPNVACHTHTRRLPQPRIHICTIALWLPLPARCAFGVRHYRLRKFREGQELGQGVAKNGAYSLTPKQHRLRRILTCCCRLATTLLLRSQATRVILKRTVRSRLLQLKSMLAAWGQCIFQRAPRPTKAPMTFFWTSASG